MKEKSIKLVAIILEVDGERKTIEKENFYFTGWEHQGDCYCDAGVDLSVKLGEKWKDIEV